jgi:hypothetical protein
MNRIYLFTILIITLHLNCYSQAISQANSFSNERFSIFIRDLPQNLNTDQVKSYNKIITDEINLAFRSKRNQPNWVKDFDWPPFFIPNVDLGRIDTYYRVHGPYLIYLTLKPDPNSNNEMNIVVNMIHFLPNGNPPENIVIFNNNVSIEDLRKTMKDVITQHMMWVLSDQGWKKPLFVHYADERSAHKFCHCKMYLHYNDSLLYNSNLKKHFFVRRDPGDGPDDINIEHYIAPHRGKDPTLSFEFLIIKDNVKLPQVFKCTCDDPPQVNFSIILADLFK